MKSLNLRNIFFAPDGKGKGKIKETIKGSNISISREALQKEIESGVPVVEIPVTGEKEKERE